MGKVRQQRHREDLDESNSSLRLNRSVNVASTSAFNVFRGFSNPLKRTSPGLNTAVRGSKKRVRRSGFAAFDSSLTNDEEVLSKRTRHDSRNVFRPNSSAGDSGQQDASTPVFSFPCLSECFSSSAGTSSWGVKKKCLDNRSRTTRHRSSENNSPPKRQRFSLDDSLDEDEDHTETDCQSAVEPHDAGSGSNNYSEIQNIYSRCSIDRSTEHFQDPKRKKRQKAVADAANVSRNNNTQNDNNDSKVDPDDLKKPAHRSWSRIEDDTIQASQDQQTSGDEDDDEKNIISRSSGNDTARPVGSHQHHFSGSSDRVPTGVRLFLHRNSVLVALSDSVMISFAGSAWLQVAHGSVRVFDVRLRPSDGPVHVQSVPGSCLLIKNANSYGNNSSNNISLGLYDRMQLMGAGLAFDKAGELIKRFPRKTIIILHGLGTADRYSSLKPNFHLATDSTPENMWSDCRFYVTPVDVGWLPNYSNKQLDILVTNFIKASTRTVIRVAIVGSRNSGKSSTMRVLCNRILHSSSDDQPQSQTDGGGGPPSQKTVPIFVLDLDPGQTEFTPSTCVSLVEVNCLLMGPPGAHQIKPRKSLLVGDSTAGARPESYVAAVNSLMSYVNNELTFNHILIVNTMGWLNGIGDLLLGTVLDIVKPCKVLATSEGIELPTMAWPAKHVQIDAPIVYLKKIEGLFIQDSYTKPVKPAEHRKATIINYFGGLSLLSKKTIALPWNSVALHEVSGLCPPQELLRLINANVVALCNAAEDTIWKSKSDPTVPMLLRETSGTRDEPMECLGFAFVRAVDMLRKTIYLITPESEETVRSANALVHCTGLNVTDYLVTNQNRGSRQGPAPYSLSTDTPRPIWEL